MRCPVDGTTLALAERADVEIDYCPQCRGVWLDRGELDRIIERLAGDGHNGDRDRRERHHDDHERSRHDDDDDGRGRYDQPRHKRGRMFSELSDLLGGGG